MLEEKIFEIDSQNSIGDIYRILRRLPYKVQTALYEYVDNSIQSFTDKRKELREVGKDEFKVEIIYFRSENKIEIIDNAGGMDLEDVRRAFKIGTPPKDPTGLSEFGVGLKGASQWFCERWEVETLSISETTKYIIEIDDSKMIENQKTVTARSIEDQPLEDSYTKITLHNIIRRISNTQINNTLEMIGATYCRHIDANFVTISILDNDRQNYNNATPWFQSSKGKNDGAVIPFQYEIGSGKKPLERKFKFTIDNGLGIESSDPIKNSIKTVTGKAIIYIPGTARKAGIHYFRRQRIVKGGRPVAGINDGGEKLSTIFGAPNSFQSQRLYIECDFDEWPISVDKSEIIFEGDSRQIFEEKLIEVLQSGDDFISLCKTATQSDQEDSGPTVMDIQDNLNQIDIDEFELQLQEVSTITDNSPFPIDVEDVEIMEEIVKTKEPDFILKGNNLSFSRCEFFIVEDETTNDPYCHWSFDLNSKAMTVALNNNHPYIKSLNLDRSRLNELLVHIWVDVLIQNNLKKKNDEKAGLFLKIKDNYLRALTNLGFNE